MHDTGSAEPGLLQLEQRGQRRILGIMLEAGPNKDQAQGVGLLLCWW